MMIIVNKPRKNKKSYLQIAIAISLLIHAPLILLRMVQQQTIPITEEQLPSSVKIKIQTKRNTIVEAPMPETEKVPVVASKGRQNHYTEKETRLPPSQKHKKGADASRESNDSKEGSGGKIKPKGYGGLLPSEGELSAYNDFIPDSSIPIGKILDINTTDYRYIAYTTSIRKSVDLAFYSPRSALKDEPHIREKIQTGAKTRFSGKSVAVMTIEKSGLLSDVKIEDSSGDKKIDEEWLRILNMAAPFPPLPVSFPDEKFMIRYTLYYDYVFREEKKTRRFQF